MTENPCREFVKQRIEFFSEKQIRNIVPEFIEYYNKQRMHQGINKIPDAELVESSGVIKKNSKIKKRLL